MATLEEQLEALTARLAQEFNVVRAEIPENGASAYTDPEDSDAVIIESPGSPESIDSSVSDLVDDTQSATYTSLAGAFVPRAQSMVVIVHGANAATARPVGATSVLWIGDVEPTNMTSADLWNGPA